MDNDTATRQDARRREVLDAALVAFSRRGYRATSMRDIARQVGLGKASLYHYVTSKEEVLILLYETVAQTGIERARQIAESEAPVVELLRAIIRSQVVYTCENQALLRVVFEEDAALPEEHLNRLRELRREYEDSILSIVARGIESGEITLGGTPRIFVNAMIGATSWTYKWYDPHGPLSPAELGDEIASTLLAGVSSAPSGS